MTDLDVDHLRSWIGRQETLHDQVTRFPIAALAATLDRDDPAPLAGDPLPPLWHWLYFLPTARQSLLGPDGHPARGGFLPPVPLPRRMWAGGRFTFHQPLRVDEAITRVSTVRDVTVKHGRNGALCFVMVRHEISGEGGLALVEEHDIVYRDMPLPGETPAAPKPARTDGIWRRDDPPERSVAVSLLGVDVQQPPDSLRQAIRYGNRGLSRAGRSRPADRHVADRSVAAKYRPGSRHVQVPRGQPAVRYRRVFGAWRAGSRRRGCAVGKQCDGTTGNGGGGDASRLTEHRSARCRRGQRHGGPYRLATASAPTRSLGNDTLQYGRSTPWQPNADPGVRRAPSDAATNRADCRQSRGASMRQIATKVLIAGGGPVGLTVAMDLAWRGIPVVVLESRAPGEPPSVKCNHVSARTMEIFRRLGVVQAVRNAGLPADYPNDVAFRTTTTGIELSRIPIPCRADRYTATGGPDTWWPTPEPPHRINQIYLEPVLFAHAQSMPGVRILNRTQVIGFEQHDGGVVATAAELDGGEDLRITADYMIGADGAHSMVRRRIGATLTGDAVLEQRQSSYIRAPELLRATPTKPAWANTSLNPRRSANMFAIDGRETWLIHNYMRSG